MASFSAFPAENFGALEAAIVVSAPICGSQPVRSATSNFPKLDSLIVLPLTSASCRLSGTASSASPASALLLPGLAAMAPISSAWITSVPLFGAACNLRTGVRRHCPTPAKLFRQAPTITS